MKILYLGIDGLDPGILLAEDSISEKLINFHRLMDMGSFGYLENPYPDLEAGNITLGDLPVWDGKQRIIPPIDKKNLILDDWDTFLQEIITRSSDCFDDVIKCLHSNGWNFLEYLDTGLLHIHSAIQSVTKTDDSAPEVTGSQVVVAAMQDYYLHLDAQLVRLFEAIAEDLIFIIVSRPGNTPYETGFFILAAPDNPLQAEIEKIKWENLGPTLLELGGYPLPETMEGKSLVNGFERPASPGGLSQEEEDILRERLSGLGYIS